MRIILITLLVFVSYISYSQDSTQTKRYERDSLTTEVENAAWKLVEKIDALGGSVNAIEQGFLQEEISKSAYKYQREIENGEKIIVGVNKFQVEEHHSPSRFKIDDSIQKIQSQKLNSLKQKRDHNKADKV